MKKNTSDAAPGFIEVDSLDCYTIWVSEGLISLTERASQQIPCHTVTWGPDPSPGSTGQVTDSPAQPASLTLPTDTLTQGSISEATL